MGKKKSSQPRKTWNDSISEFIKRKAATWKEVKQSARNRNE